MGLPLDIRRAAASLALLVAVSGSYGCEKKPDPGFLKVGAPTQGSFEIYRIANESPLQFVSEQSGKYNEDVALTPGSYLVLADCSSETVTIYPGQIQVLTAHRLRFTAPHTPDSKDSFSIQCSRSDKTKSRQHLSGRYELTVLHGKRDLLVGMVPMRIDFDAMGTPDAPKDLDYRLSALQVANFEGNTQEISYFISPLDELIAATKYQQFGQWEFLLPGRYVLEVNGTRMQVDLAEGEERIVKPALLKVTTSSEIDLDQPAHIKGSPWLVEINTGHWLNFNETYPVLPGSATIAISGSSQSVDVPLVEGESTELKARSITVDSGCLPLDMTCLGDKDVSLYLPEEPYPFIESVSDIPVLFIDRGLPVLIGIEGSRDILYEVPADVRDKAVRLGYVRLIPEPQHRPGQITDLVRVEGIQAPFSGHTLDIVLEKTTVMPLIAGTYHMAHFISATTADVDRRNASRLFTVDAGATVDVAFPVFFSEKKFAAFRRKVAADASSEQVKSLDMGTYKPGLNQPPL